MRTTSRRAMGIAVLLMLIAAGPRLGGAENEGSVEELRRELQAMKRRLAEVEEQTRKQEERIHKQEAVIGELTGKKPPSATAPVHTAEDEQLQKRVTENVLRRIQPSLAAANKTFASQFNPAIGFVIDSAASYSRKDRANFEFRSGEIGISASIDPFARGFAILNGTPDGIEVEEAGDRHHLAALQPDRQGRALLRRLRPTLQVPRPRPAVRESSHGARRVRGRRVAGRRRRDQLARAASRTT